MMLIIFNMTYVIDDEQRLLGKLEDILQRKKVEYANASSSCDWPNRKGCYLNLPKFFLYWIHTLY